MASKSPAVEIEVDDRVVRVTNPDRVYFPARGETKLDLVEYYLSVRDGIVNALRERPCMLHRFPTGVSGEKVHQKRLPAGAPPWMETVQVHFPRWNRTADELCVTEIAQVVWAVQMSTVEFHPWNSRRADTEKPDEWRIDLDPGDAVRLRHGAPRGPRDPRGARRARGDRLPEDLRRQGPAHLRADPPGARVQGRATGGPGLRARGRAPHRRRDDDLVAQGPRPHEAVRGLQPERPRPHDRCCLLRARATPRPRSPPRSGGPRSTTSIRATSRSRRCRPATPRSATSTPASTTPCST